MIHELNVELWGVTCKSWIRFTTRGTFGHIKNTILWKAIISS